MPPFVSTHSVNLEARVDHVFSTLSSQEAFEAFIKLSPAAHTIEILSVSHPRLSPTFVDTVLTDTASPGPNASAKPSRAGLNVFASPSAEEDDLDNKAAFDSSSQGLEAARYRFKLVERIPILGGLSKTDVEVFGSQIVIPSRKVHLYESSANGGLVLILKVRRFEADCEETRIDETINGETNWFLRKYTEGSCRKAHREHMAKYHELLEKPLS